MKASEALLWPLTVPYGAAARSRSWAYRAGVLRPKRLNGVVISVGNLTVGGTGKTPMVLWMAERLAVEGKRAGILTRGYRGEAAAEGSTSDEVQLLKARLGERVPIGVGADRFERGRELARQGIEWFVLDDGFQHLQLARDVDIVLIDATNPFGGGHLLPAGRLREPRSALARADIIVITRSDHAPALEEVLRRDSEAPIFYARATLDSVRSLTTGGGAPEFTAANAGKLFAFCGIGNPEAFLGDLRRWGFQITGHAFFRDHHRFSPVDVRAIEQQAKDSGASALICTEKDAFNLADARPSMDILVCRISLSVSKEAELWADLERLAAARDRREGRPI